MQRQKKTGSSKLRSKFETLRREIKADVRKQHDLYVNNLVGDVKVNPRDFYRYINSQKKDAQDIPPLKRKNGSSIYRLYKDRWSRLTYFYFLKKIHLVQFKKKKKIFFSRHFVFFLKSSMVSFLEYILDSICVFKVVDFKLFGLHRLVWFLLRK